MSLGMTSLFANFMNSVRQRQPKIIFSEPIRNLGKFQTTFLNRDILKFTKEFEISVYEISLICDNMMNNGNHQRQLESVLTHVAPFMSFAELRRLRLVSKPCDQEITGLTVPNRSVIKMDKKWTSKPLSFLSTQHEQGQMQQQSLKYVPNWKNVIFDHFPLRQNQFIHRCWTTAERNVTSVTLKNILMSCEEYCIFLHKCRSLQEVTLAKLSFEVDSGQDGRDGGLTYSFLCRHTSCHINQDEFRDKSLKKISIQNIPVIPLCILDFLRSSTNGQLLEFECKNGEFVPPKRALLIPTLETMMESIRTLLQENAQSLRHLAWENITSGHTILDNFLQPTANGVENVGNASGLVQLKFVQGKQWADGVGSENHYLDFAARQLTQSTRLEELELDLFYGPNVIARLEQMLPLMIRLKKLTIAIQGTRNEVEPYRHLDLRQLQACTLMQYLTISDKVDHPCILNDFLTVLPPSLKGLNFHLRDTRNDADAMVFDMLNAPRSNTLTCLTIKRGISINDDAMQIIIANMPGLQELCINDSPILTDVGITGWPKNVVDSIEETGSIVFLDSEELEASIQVKRTLRELIHLRRLILSGCKELSDISAHSINFLHLRDLDVSSWGGLTDLGLGWIGNHNPCLERLNCTGVKKISKPGVNALLVNTHFKIQNILISPSTMKKTFGRMYNICPQFEKFVTVCNSSSKTIEI